MAIVLAGCASGSYEIEGVTRPERSARARVDSDGGGAGAQGGFDVQQGGDASAGQNASPSGASPGRASCTDGTRNGDEADVDCGGAICPACANGASCASRLDCVSLLCLDGRCSGDLGCADGTREGFVSPGAFPDVAACSGGWSVPGIVAPAAPACGRASGNSGANPTGAGCNVADLCQAGWHVCATVAELAVNSGGMGCAGASVAGLNAFFAARQSSVANGQCAVGTNDLFGCGDVGAVPDSASCAPLDRFSGDVCAALPATWSCGADSADEANRVTKTASDGGGVLCCRD